MAQESIPMLEKQYLQMSIWSIKAKTNMKNKNKGVEIIRFLFIWLEYIVQLTYALVCNILIGVLHFIISLKDNRLNQMLIVLSVFTIGLYTIISVCPQSYPQSEVNFPPHPTEEQLYESSLMEAAITYASLEYQVPRSLIVGIAHAESSYGKHFYNKADVNCHNWWGLKGGPDRSGSFIRCFNDEMAGARTVAKTLRLYYLDEGRLDAESICQKWIGSAHAELNCPDWVATVNKFNK